MNKFFTADAHFNHANIIKYTGRPQLKAGDLDQNGSWVSKEISCLRAKEMNDFYINNFNMRAKADDLIYCIGDFACYGSDRGVHGIRVKAEHYLKILNGNWILLTGNHDKRNRVKTCCEFMIIKLGHYKVGLQHVPLYDETQRQRFSAAHIRYCQSELDFMLCGHVHEKWLYKVLNNVLHINVGVDVWKHNLVKADEIIAFYERIKRDKTQ